MREPLTPEDLARHQRGIAKLRKQLFRLHSPTDYFIVPDSEQVVAASAEGRWCEGRGNYRVFTFGGLRYRCDCADDAGLSTFNVVHQAEDRFTFWLVTAQGWTASCFIVRFREIDRAIYKRIRSFRNANISPDYTGKRSS